MAQATFPDDVLPPEGTYDSREALLAAINNGRQIITYACDRWCHPPNLSKDQSYEFLTYINVDTSSTSPDQIRQDAFDGKYWAVIVVQPGATARFDEAVNGTTSSYDPSDVYTYYLLTARYYTLYAGGIQSSPITTASAAAGIFSAQFIGPKLGSGEFVNTTVSLSALTTPARAVGASASIHNFSTENWERGRVTLSVSLKI